MKAIAASAAVLLATVPAVLGFRLPGASRVAARAPCLARHNRGGIHRRGSVLQQARLRMMAEDGEWFNPGAVARLARSAPSIPKPRAAPVMAPVLLEGVLEWGYYAGMSWEGRGKGTQVGGIVNQDAIIASSLDASTLFSVFDGHGEYGGEASTLATQLLPTNVYEVEAEIDRAGMDTNKLQPLFQTAYFKTHEQLLAQQDFDTFLSGSTCITVLVVGPPGKRRVLVSNAGDCRVILGTEGWGGKAVTTQLSIDQTPDRPDERKRIEGLGGMVGMVNPELSPMAVMSPEDAGASGLDLGPVRVFWPDGSFEPPYESCFPGLAMSRSLGDSCLDEIGVLPVPEVTARALKPKDRFLVMASDGVWQVVPPSLCLVPVCVCVSMDACVHRDVCVCVCARASVYACMYVCLCMRVYIFQRACMCVCLYPCMYAIRFTRADMM